MNRFTAWLVRRLGPTTLVVFFLLLAALTSVLFGITQMASDLSLGRLTVTATIALLLAWQLARRPFPGWSALLIISLLGVVVAFWQTAHLGRPVVDLLAAWLGRAPRELVRVQIDAVLQAGRQTWAALIAVAAGQDTGTNEPVTFFWHLVSWGLAGWAAWAVRRYGRPLWGIAPAGVLLAAALSYSRDEPGSLLGLVMVIIPMLALTRHQARKRQWRAEQVDYSEDIDGDLGLTIAGLTLALTALALLMPVLGIRPVEHFAWRLVDDIVSPSHKLAASLGLSQQLGQPEALEPLRVPGLPRQHLLGAGPELSEQVILQIETDPAAASLPYPLHWRSHTYDQYTGRGWLTSSPTTVDYRPGQTITDPGPLPHLLLHQNVRAAPSTGGLLFAAGAPISVDREVQVSWRTAPDEEQPGDSFGAVVESNVYQALSWLPDLSESELRQAGETYPAEVEERYLQLPENVSDRVRDLAHELVREAETPYDQATALQSYLRGLPYTLDLPAPPAGREISDYFLFELQTGYCDYYATSMVVLARAVGLPARLVVGYISNRPPDPGSDLLLISAADAHSWVEIYFAGSGWVEFEPTAGQPVLERPPQPAPEVIPEVLFPLGERPWWQPDSQWLRWWPIALAPLLAAALWTLADSWRLRRLGTADAGITLYQRLSQHARRLLARPLASVTPHELAQQLAGELDQRTAGGRWRPFFAAGRQEIQSLVDLYVQISYSSHPPRPASGRGALRSWRKLRRRLWLARFFPRTP